MEVLDIIEQDARKNGKRPADVMTGVMIAIDKRKAKLLHDNKSVVILEPINGKQNSFDLHLFTADTPMGVANSAKNFLRQIYAMNGVQKVYGTTKNQQLIRLLKMTGVNVQESDLDGYTWMTEL